jgi:hypothetical protein
MKNFKVEFVDNKNKYNKSTRTVDVVAENEDQAKLLVQSRFGSFQKAKGKDALKSFMFPSDRSPITIESVTEVEESEDEDIGNGN